MECAICHVVKAAKYKCPKCAAPYCSVACSKLHKESCGKDVPCAPSSNSSGASTTIPSSEEFFRNFGKLPLSQKQLERVSQNEDIREKLRNPLLREQMVEILNSNDPMKALESVSAQNKPLLDFIEELMKILEV